MKVSEIKTGETYNNIKVLADLGRKSGSRYYLCKCLLCGKELEIRADHIGNTNGCRQCSAKARIIDLKGQRFGRLVALEYMGRENGRTLWRCKCDCGNESITGYSNLVNGGTRSCGCMEDENRIANMKKVLVERTKSVSDPLEFGVISEHPLYSIWSSMIIRCYNSNRKTYKHYGGRGIKVCDRWKGDNGFENFIKDMGERPSLKHTIDRIDYNGDYSPENCRWATWIEQANNTRTNVYVFYEDKRISAKQLFDTVGLSYGRAIWNLRNGLDINFILSHKGLALRTKELKKLRDQNINFNKIISKEMISLLPKEVINNLLTKI